MIEGLNLWLVVLKVFKNFSYDISGNISWSRAKWDHYEEQIYTDPDQRKELIRNLDNG